MTDTVPPECETCDEKVRESVRVLFAHFRVPSRRRSHLLTYLLTYLLSNLLTYLLTSADVSVPRFAGFSVDHLITYLSTYASFGSSPRGSLLLSTGLFSTDNGFTCLADGLCGGTAPDLVARRPGGAYTERRPIRSVRDQSDRRDLPVCQRGHRRDPSRD